MFKDNASPKAGALYGALNMPFAGLVGQLAGHSPTLNCRRSIKTPFTQGVGTSYHTSGRLWFMRAYSGSMELRRWR
jgi:hypothetical protein